MSKKISTFTMVSLSLTLLSGIVLTGCSSSDDDANRCCRPIGWHSGTNGTNNSDNGIAGIMAAEDGEFSIMPVEEPIVIDDQTTGGGEDENGSNSLRDLWQQHLDGNQGSGDEVDYSVL